MASVGRMLKTTHGNHIVYLNGFDPATQTVVIVSKDAQRVWIAKNDDDDDEFISLNSPQWERRWYSGGKSIEFGDDTEHRLGLSAGDCVEFVAVETKRPPEPIKPVELSQEQMAKVFAERVAANPGILSEIQYRLETETFVEWSESVSPVDFEPIPADVQAEVSAVMRAAGIPKLDLDPLGCCRHFVCEPVPSLEVT